MVYRDQYVTIVFGESANADEEPSAAATLLEATIEGFFVFRLWLVTRKRWVRSISAFLWVRTMFRLPHTPD